MRNVFMCHEALCDKVRVKRLMGDGTQYGPLRGIRSVLIYIYIYIYMYIHIERER